MPSLQSSLAHLLVAACAACAATPIEPTTSTKVAVELANVNAEGLRGPSAGLRAVHYEFCIPVGDRYAAEVRGIDPTARLMPGSPGRIGCTQGHILVLGNTHQRAYRRVLDQLANLPYVERITENFFE